MNINSSYCLRVSIPCPFLIAPEGSGPRAKQPRTKPKHGESFYFSSATPSTHPGPRTIVVAKGAASSGVVQRRRLSVEGKGLNPFADGCGRVARSPYNQA